MHLLVAAHDFYPDPGSGGTGRYVYETARRLVAKGHEVSVLTRRRGSVPRVGTVDGISVYRYDLSIAEETAPAILRQLPTAARTVRNHVVALSKRRPPDVVSFQGPVTSLLAERTLHETHPSIPRVTTFHSPWPAEYAIRTRASDGASGVRRGSNVALRWALERRLLRRSDGVVTLSEHMRGQLRRRYGCGTDATVVPGGVDTARFAPDAGRFEPMEDADISVLTVRRLAERMGHDRLLESFAKVRERTPDAHLYVAGDGPLRPRLERRTVALGIDHATTFLGYVPDEALPAAYATADLFVLPTRDLEGFGLATLEALASGTPVVATPVGGTVEVLDGLRDRLPRDPLTTDATADAIAEGTIEWVSLDPAALESAGATCRCFAREEYSWDETVSRLLREYRRHVTRSPVGHDGQRVTHAAGTQRRRITGDTRGRDATSADHR